MPTDDITPETLAMWKALAEGDRQGYRDCFQSVCSVEIRAAGFEKMKAFENIATAANFLALIAHVEKLTEDLNETSEEVQRVLAEKHAAIADRDQLAKVVGKFCRANSEPAWWGTGTDRRR